MLGTFSQVSAGRRQIGSSHTPGAHETSARSRPFLLFLCLCIACVLFLFYVGLHWLLFCLYCAFVGLLVVVLHWTVRGSFETWPAHRRRNSDAGIPVNESTSSDKWSSDWGVSNQKNAVPTGLPVRCRQASCGAAK